MKKVCFAASSGGHFEQLSMLKPLMEQYDSFIITEKTEYDRSIDGIKTYRFSQVNRREILFPIKMIGNAVRSLIVYIKEKPDVIVTTGVLAVIPMCLWCKIFGKKLIYIESFAKINTPTETGKLMYRFADRFFVQWESMLEIYPKAEYIGGIY